MRKLVPMTMLAWTLAVAAFAPASESNRGPKRELLASSLSGNPLRSDEARPHRRAAKRAHRRAQRARVARREGRSRGAAGSASPQLEAIAACESGGDPTAVSASGAYRGKYQFSPATWRSVGGAGDPASAPEAEQDRRAAILMSRSGPGQWPVCGA